MEPDKPHPPCVKYCIFSAVFFFFPNGDFHVIYPPLVWCLASQQLADLDRYTCSIAYKDHVTSQVTVEALCIQGLD